MLEMSNQQDSGSLANIMGSAKVGSAALSHDVPGLSYSDALRAEFECRMRGLAAASATYEKARFEINRFITSDIDSRHAERDVEHAVRKWVSDVCSRVNAAASNIGHLYILPSRLRDRCSGIDFRDLYDDNSDDIEPLLNGVEIWHAPCETLVQLAIRYFPVEELYEALREQVEGIEHAACVDAADKLAGAFGLVSARSSVGSCRVQEKCGRIVLDMSNYGGYSFERARGFAETGVVASTFERASGVYGICACLEFLRDAERALDSDKRIPSRTKFCAGRPVEAVCFKEKIEFRFERVVFEALVAFVRQYSSRPMLELVS